MRRTQNMIPYFSLPLFLLSLFEVLFIFTTIQRLLLEQRSDTPIAIAAPCCRRNVSGLVKGG